jgi:hypothetical protein
MHLTTYVLDMTEPQVANQIPRWAWSTRMEIPFMFVAK